MGRTKVGTEGIAFQMNGRAACPGSIEAAGRLMNVRMVNCIFEDMNPETCPDGFGPEINTEAFIAAIPQYRTHGVLAFTVGLQGGFPGYEGALNSAFLADGSLKDDYLTRAAKVIEACGAQGMAIILSLFYQRQDQVFESENAVRSGVVNAVDWVASEGYGNVLVEIANEFEHEGFTQGVIRDPSGMASLITLAKETQPGLLISASGLGDSQMAPEVAEAADFITLHGNSSSPQKMAEGTRKCLEYGRPVIFNEDDKLGDEAASACEAVFNAGGSWGYMNSALNQYYPFKWGIEPGDDQIVYDKMREITGAK